MEEVSENISEQRVKGNKALKHAEMNEKNIKDVSTAVDHLSIGLKSIIDYVKEDSEFLSKLSGITGKVYNESKEIYSSIAAIDDTAKEVITHFDDQRQVLDKKLGWMKDLGEMSRVVSENLDNLTGLSTKLEEKSVEIDNVVKKVV